MELLKEMELDLDVETHAKLIDHFLQTTDATKASFIAEDEAVKESIE